MTRRTSEEKEQLTRRLKRIEGQVRGIQRMIADDKYCVDIIIQISAAKAALNKVGLNILESHTQGCVKNALQEGRKSEEIIEELMDVISRFTKN